MQLLVTYRTIFINPASIWTKNAFHQIWGLVRSVLGLYSSLYHVFATQPRSLSSVQYCSFYLTKNCFIYIQSFT